MNFYYDVWDPTTNSHKTLSYNGGEKGTNIFCSGQVQVSSTGEIFITGGSEVINGTKNYGIAHAQFFNPADDSLELAENNMHEARWYPSVTSLGNSKIVVQGGTRYIWRSYLSLGDTDTKRLTVVISLSLLLLSLVATGNTTPKRGITTPEVYNPKTGKWKLLTGANSTLCHQGSAWWYPRSYSASGNTVILFPSFQNDIWRLDPRGDGSLTKFATVPLYLDQFSISKLPQKYSIGTKTLRFKVLKKPSCLDIRNPNATTYEKTGQIREQRFWSNTVALPKGEVLVVGGASVSQQLDTAVKYAEIWNPTTGEWRIAAEAVEARLYHSTAILLPDATVLVGGGGRPGPVVNENVEIYSPPYLFQANGEPTTRPVITSLPTNQPAYGGTIHLRFSDAAKIDRVSLIRLGSVTHSFNMDERMASLEFTQHRDMVTTKPSPSLRGANDFCDARGYNFETATTSAPESMTTPEYTTTT